MTIQDSLRMTEHSASTGIQSPGSACRHITRRCHDRSFAALRSTLTLASSRSQPRIMDLTLLPRFFVPGLPGFEDPGPLLRGPLPGNLPEFVLPGDITLWGSCKLGLFSSVSAATALVRPGHAIGGAAFLDSPPQQTYISKDTNIQHASPTPHTHM